MGNYYTWWAGEPVKTAVSQHISPILVSTSDAPEQVTDYPPQVWLSPDKTLDPYVFESVKTMGKTLQLWGLVGAKLCLSNRTYCVTVLHKSYTADTPYEGAYSQTESVISMPHVFVQDAMTTTEDRDYADLVICIRHPTSVTMNSSSLYGDPLNYKSRSYPLPLHKGSINSLYVPRGISYCLSMYLRRLEYQTRTLLIVSDTIVYENVTAGLLDNTLDRLIGDAIIPRQTPWTKEWFDIPKPMYNKLRTDTYENTYTFQISMRYMSPSLIHALAGALSEQAHHYYVDKFVILVSHTSPISLTLVFTR